MSLRRLIMISFAFLAIIISMSYQLAVDAMRATRYARELQRRSGDGACDHPANYRGLWWPDSDRKHGDGRALPLALRYGGAVNFLAKPVREEVLFSAVQQALAPHENNRKNNELHHKVRASLAMLTSREHEIMRYILSGARNRQNEL